MLEELNLVWANMNDDRMENLAGLTRLKKLNLEHNEITDVSLKHLRSLTDLRELSLNYTKVRGPGLDADEPAPARGARTR